MMFRWIDSRKMRRVFRAPAWFYFMVVMRASLKQSVVPTWKYHIFKSVSRVAFKTWVHVMYIQYMHASMPSRRSSTAACVRAPCGARVVLSCPNDWFVLVRGFVVRAERVVITCHEDTGCRMNRGWPEPPVVLALFACWYKISGLFRFGSL
jgi:hypothetical protein